MRTYTLSDRDFEEFYAIMEKIEIENRLKHGHEIRHSGCKECDLQATYRYYFISWRNRVMSGDTHFRGPDPHRDDTVSRIKAEIKHLQGLLPKEEPDGKQV